MYADITDFFLSLLLIQHAYAECPNQFECVKQGDIAMAQGDYLTAIERFKSSCDQGFALGCEALKEAKQGYENLKNKTDPDSKSKYALLGKIQDCASKKTKSADDCLASSRELRKNGMLEAAISIQKPLCDQENAKACFELGISQVKNNSLSDAGKAYLTGCSLGNQPSCEASRSLTANIEADESRKERERIKQNELAAEERRIQEEKDVAERKRNQALIQAFEGVGKALVGASEDENDDKYATPECGPGSRAPIAQPRCKNICINGKWNEICR